MVKKSKNIKFTFYCFTVNYQSGTNLTLNKYENSSAALVISGVWWHFGIEKDIRFFLGLRLVRSKIKLLRKCIESSDLQPIFPFFINKGQKQSWIEMMMCDDIPRCHENNTSNPHRNGTRFILFTEFLIFTETFYFCSSCLLPIDSTAIWFWFSFQLSFLI